MIVMKIMEKSRNGLANLGKYDIVLAADFGHGLAENSKAISIKQNSFANVQTNSYNRGFNLITKYDSANFACVDGPEARLALADNVNSIENISSQTLKKLRLEELS